VKAAVVQQLSRPLVIEERAVPTPGPGQVVVQIEASGLCHTDIHAANGDWPVRPTPPFVPGHEGVGLITAVGDGVPPSRVGQRVAIPWLHVACGTCEFCVSGWETLCSAQRNTGYSVDGCYAEYVLAEAAYVVPVPGGIDPMEAAPLTCAGVTTYKAVKMSGARPSDLVAVFGVGGLGHLAVQYATIAGATVVAVDVTEGKLDLAKRLGATYTVNAAVESPADAIGALGGADAAVVTAASQQPFREAFGSLRRGGRLVLVGLPAENELPVPIFETVLNGITIVGSIVGTRLDLAETFELHAAGRTSIEFERRALEDVNAAFDEVLSGSVAGRLVFDLRSR
jgi:propanol-preferring alcohol dehydrogenase